MTRKYYDIVNDYPQTRFANCKVYCVYVVQFGNEYKIGKTDMPRQRLDTIQSLKKQALDRYCLIMTNWTSWLESGLHDKFADKRLHGEWFNLSDEDFEYLRQLKTVLY